MVGSTVGRRSVVSKVFVVAALATAAALVGCVVPGGIPSNADNVRRLVEREYGDQASDIEVETIFVVGESDIPWYRVAEPAYIATFRLDDVPLTMRLRVFDYEMVQYEPGYDANESGEWYVALLPSSIELPLDDLKALLIAYADGSGEGEAAEVYSGEWTMEYALGAVSVGDDGSYDIRECWVISADIGEWLGGTCTGEQDYVVHLDPETGTATYLGTYSQVFTGTIPQ